MGNNMGKKYLLIVSLIVFILTISAVSASQDINESIEHQKTQDSINESLQLYNADEKLNGEEIDDFKVNITDKIINLDDSQADEESIVSIYFPESSKGELYIRLFAPNKAEVDAVYVKNIESDDLGKTVNITFVDFDNKLQYIGPGEYNVKVLYYDNYDMYTIADGMVMFEKTVSDKNFRFKNYMDGNTVIEFISSPINGNVTVYVDGRECYNKNITKGRDTIYITPKDLNIAKSGEHEISLKFISDNYGIFNLSESSYFKEDEYTSISENINVLDEYVPIIKIIDWTGINGTITVTIDGKEAYKKSFNGENRQLDLYPYNLDLSGIEYGAHYLEVNYNRNNEEENIVGRTVNIYELPNFYFPTFMYEGEKQAIIITTLKEYTGKFEIFDTKNGNILLYSGNLTKGYGIYSLENLSKGNYILNVRCTVDQIPQEFSGHAHIEVNDNSPGYSSAISSDSITLGDLVTLTLTGKISGKNAVVFVDGFKYGEFPFTSGNISVAIPNLNIGQHRITIKHESQGNEYRYSETYLVNVTYDLLLKITATSVYQGEKTTITVTTNNTFSGKVNLKIASKNYVVDVVNGKGTKTISGLGVGTYTATAIFSGTDLFAASSKSVTFKVNTNTVKLTLKKVSVKKSGKKLLIQATLKINGKAVKGKKLKFKFNKKTYTAKTNKKGIAKITIKKNVLNKLKKGKKVKYQVTYGKKTVKRTVKVKK